MRLSTKRIFISDLPETATETEIKSLFQEYGKVELIEIKERRELGPKNSSLFFAYVNLETDDNGLQKCFQDFRNQKWNGNYVQLQLARESFLDRLKREREEQNQKEQMKPVPQKAETNTNGVIKAPVISKPTVTKPNNKKAIVESSDSESSSESESETKQFPKENKAVLLNEEPSDIVIKNNKGKIIDKNGLKIASVGKEPIIKIEAKKKQKNDSESNLKRLQSLKNMKQSYQNQKQLIQSALANVDHKKNTKITFNNDESTTQHLKVSEKKRKSLFEEEEDNENDFTPDFSVKEQFEGKAGQKLLELQSKYKNDKRFKLDSRFAEEEDNYQEEPQRENLDEEDIAEEKRKEFEILEQVLGKPFNRRQKNDEKTPKKTMLRFDPNHPEHSQFELQAENHEPPSKKKKKNKEIAKEVLEMKKTEEKETPEVSKEIFYKVDDNLKETLKENQGFSLLSMFGQAEEPEENSPQTEENFIKPKLNGTSSNPFKYDSSDDEAEQEQQNEVKPQNTINEKSRGSFWSEPFFFKQDDYRLQEGFDFLEKIKGEEKGEFVKLRKDLKSIVKAKVRNNLRKNKPFKKKLGGNQKRKVKRINKALNR